MVMESPAVESAGPPSGHGSPSDTPPVMHTLQPMGTMAQSTETISATTQASMPQISMQQTFLTVAAPQVTSADQSSQQTMMMQPPMSLPFVMSPYQMLLPTQALIQQQAAHQQAGSPAAGQQAVGSPASVGSPVDGRGTPQKNEQQQQVAIVTTAYAQQQQGLSQESQHKSEHSGAPSPLQQGSLSSRASPAPATPGSLGSPLPGVVADGVTTLPLSQLPLQVPVQYTYTTTPTTTAPAPLPQPEVKVQTKEEQQELAKTLKPPKKPLTPYMRFSKSIWQSVKAAHSSMSVCEIGAQIGRMWRELGDLEKQKYNEEFTRDKGTYDEEIQRYLKLTGLQPSDLVKQRSKKHREPKEPKHAPAPTPPPAQQAPAPQPAAQPAHQPAQQVHNAATVTQVSGQTATLMGLPLGINGPVPVSFHSGAGGQTVIGGPLAGLPHFQQVWTGQETDQQQLVIQQGPGGQTQQVVIQAVNGSQGADGASATSGPLLIQHTGQHNGQGVQFLSNQAPHWSWPRTSKIDAQLAAIAVSQAQDAGQQKAEDAAQQVAVEQGAGGEQAAQLAASWGWPHATGADAQTQQNMLNLLNMAAAAQGQVLTAAAGGQPDQLTQAAQIAGLQPVMGVPIGGESATLDAESQHQGQTGEDGSDKADQNSATQSHTLSNGPEGGGAATLHAASAHNLYNSYGFNPWSAYTAAGQQQVIVTGAPTTVTLSSDGLITAAGDACKPVYHREIILETELQHLRSALSEKTKEVQRLTQELEKAYNIIEQLKQQNPTAIIQLPVTQAPPGLQIITTAPLAMADPSVEQSPPTYSNATTSSA